LTLLYNKTPSVKEVFDSKNSMRKGDPAVES